jgi:HPt (histidine-containing phosphotransfer) domain-containing protein
MTNTAAPPRSGQGVLDHELALSRVGGDAELLKELCELFLEEYPRLLKQMQDAYQEGQATPLSRAAHSLKGCVANFGAKGAVDLAAEIEHLSGKGDLQSVGEMIRNLDLTLLALQAELTSL